MSLIHHPTRDFLDFVDWLNLHVPQQKAVASLLCWLDHGLSVDDLHGLSVLLDHLADDLKQQTEKAHQAWREREGGNRPALPFEEAVRRVRFAPPGTDMGCRDLEDAALLLRVREKTRFPDVLSGLLDRFLGGQIDREKVVARLGQIEKGIEEGRPFEMPRGAKDLPKPAVRGRPRPATSGTATSDRRR